MLAASVSHIRKQRERQLKAEEERHCGTRYVDERTMSRILTHAYKVEAAEHNRSRLYIIGKVVGVCLIITGVVCISAKCYEHHTSDDERKKPHVEKESFWLNDVITWSGSFLLVGIGIFILILRSNRFRKEEEGLFRSIKNQLRQSDLEVNAGTECRDLTVTSYDFDHADNTSLAVSSLADFEEVPPDKSAVKPDLDKITEEVTVVFTGSTETGPNSDTTLTCV